MTTREALAQEWRERLEDFAESDLTVQQWCHFHRLSIHQYYYWRRRLARIDNPPTTQQQFLALNVLETTPIPTAPGGITLRIAGAAIEVTPGFDASLLRAVVGALATQPC